MAVHVMTDGYLDLNAVNQDNHINVMRLSMSIEELEASTMGDTTKIYKPGLKEFTLEVEYRNDLTDDQVDEQLWDLWDQRTEFAVEFRSDSAAVSAANPKYTFTGFVTQLGGMGGTHGQLSGGPLTIRNTTAMTRATS